jgi:DnaK suppressor protein
MAQPISPDDAIGRVSRMDAINNKSVLDAALRKAKIKLEKLLLAQKEINNKNFGLCVRCSCEIPIERLIIIPESKKCVSCS